MREGGKEGRRERRGGNNISCTCPSTSPADRTSRLFQLVTHTTSQRIPLKCNAQSPTVFTKTSVQAYENTATLTSAGPFEVLPLLVREGKLFASHTQTRSHWHTKHTDHHSIPPLSLTPRVQHGIVLERIHTEALKHTLTYKLRLCVGIPTQTIHWPPSKSAVLGTEQDEQEMNTPAPTS